MANKIISNKKTNTSLKESNKIPSRIKILNKIDSNHILEHNQTFHASLRDGVRCHTDVSTNENGLTIKGWLFGEGEDVKDIQIRKENLKGNYCSCTICSGYCINEKLNIKRTERKDVENFYDPIEPLGKIGYEITCDDKIKVGEKLYLECNTIKNKTFKVFEVIEVKPSLGVNDVIPGIIAIDNFYNDPMAVRELALQQDFQPSEYHKGKRTKFKLTVPGVKEKIESVLGRRITDWDSQAHNTVFQSCTSSDPLVYHYDHQDYAAMIFLTPDAPPECGTTFYRHKKETWLDRELEVGKNNVKDEKHKQELEHSLIGSKHDDFLDGTKWEVTDSLGNKFNRFVMFDSKQIHAASKYFGSSVETGRLFQMFFFNIEK